ncbi:MAG: PhnD/SsuA/transferrin family substrate-binding protein [Acidobacteria bacterium]|nr:PhnD/SsuA/transferrin family substrate-binding protein [Acidobacteriota bacterium]
MFARRPSDGSQLSRRQALAALAAGCSILTPAEAQHRAGTVRFGISDSLTAQMNAADASAAMRVWMKKIEQDTNLNLVYAPSVFEPFPSLATALRNGELDGLIANIAEYRQVRSFLNPSTIILPSQKANLHYVLLTRAEEADKAVAGLRGRKLLMLDSLYTTLSSSWLANLLEDQGHPPPETFFSSVTRKTKATQTILPVFFGQADACLVTGHAFLTLCELNPQVAQRLKPVATSPEVATLLWSFSRHADAQQQQLIIRVLQALPDTPVGRQIMMLFQCDRLIVRPSEFLQPSLAILARAEQRKKVGT